METQHSNTYTYWQNKNSYHEKMLFKTIKDSITEADKQFEQHFGFKAESKPWISCVINEERFNGNTPKTQKP